MKQLFKLPSFNKWMRQNRVTDVSLCEAVEEMSKGLIDAELGAGLVKKRLALSGQGKRGGARILVATNKRERWFFLFGFRKNDRDNISENEKRVWQELASIHLNLSKPELDCALLNHKLLEVKNHEEEV